MFVDVAVSFGVLAIFATGISLIATLILAIMRKRQWKKGLLIAGISFLLIFVFGFSAKFYQMYEDGLSEEPSSDDAEFIQGVQVEGELPDIEVDNITDKLIAIGFTPEETAEVREIFLLCGLDDIRGFAPVDSSATIDGLVAYREVIDKDRTAWFTIENRKLFYIALNGIDVYDSDKGGFLININDIHIPESYVSKDVANELKELSESILDGYFLNALYYDAWGFARADNEYTAQCQVEAKNGLGTKDWIYAKVWYEYADGEFTVTGVVIDGVRYK